MAVDLVAGVPGPKATVARARPPARETPKAEPAKPRPKPKEAALEPRQVEVTKKPPAKDPEPEPEPLPADPATDPAASDAAEADVPGAGDETGDESMEDGGVAGNVGGGSLIGSEYAWYSARVTAALRSNWRRPPLGNVRQSLTVIVGFEILRSGAVRNPRVLESSGVPTLDRSALRAVVDAQPLPALPRGISASVVPARFEFTWYPGDS
jgi:protein TonB